MGCAGSKGVEGKPKSEAAEALSDVQIAAIKGKDLKDGDGDTLCITTIDRLDPTRHAIYAAAAAELPDFPMGTGASVASVHGTNANGAVEHIVVVTNTEPIVAEQPIVTEDKISFDEVPLSAIVEYRFADAPWMLGSVTEETLAYYVSSKFKIWLELLMSGGGGCKRAFKSLLRTGLVTSIYDPISFPSPPADAAAWQVQDENTGKPVDIPRPVRAIRVWDAAAKAYKTLPSRVEGAPSEAEEKAFWAKTIAGLKELHGADQIDELLL